MGRPADLPTAADFARGARAHAGGHPPGRGEVYLVGAGPGDPELLTLRALKLMQCADVALYDNLISPEVLDLLPPSTERIYVGKRRALHTMRQEEINALLVRYAKAGKRVLRLKGGDPFIFGRGGEEIDTLVGKSHSLRGGPGYYRRAGRRGLRRHPPHSPRLRAVLPVRHREPARTAAWTSIGRRSRDRGRRSLCTWDCSGLPVLCEQLIAHGMKPATSAAVVQQGTRRHAARRHRHAEDAARPRHARPPTRADADHRRRCRAPARAAQLVQIATRRVT